MEKKRRLTLAEREKSTLMLALEDRLRYLDSITKSDPLALSEEKARAQKLLDRLAKNGRN